MSEICIGGTLMDLSEAKLSHSVILDSDFNVTCHSITTVDSVVLDIHQNDRVDNNTTRMSISNSIASVFVIQSSEEKQWDLIIVCQEISDSSTDKSSCFPIYWTNIRVGTIGGFDVDSIQNTVFYIRESDSTVNLLFSAIGSEDKTSKIDQVTFLVELNICDWHYHRHSLDRIITKDMVSLLSSNCGNGVIKCQRLSANRPKKIVACGSRGVIAVQDETNKLFILDMENDE